MWPTTVISHQVAWADWQCPQLLLLMRISEWQPFSQCSLWRERQVLLEGPLTSISFQRVSTTALAVGLGHLLAFQVRASIGMVQAQTWPTSHVSIFRIRTSYPDLSICLPRADSLLVLCSCARQIVTLLRASLLAPSTSS